MEYEYLMNLQVKLPPTEALLFMKKKVKTIPEKPGIYMFFSEDGDIIYVGKSRCLKKRVGSYFTGTKSGKILSLVRNIRDVEYITTPTHLEARITECMKIKEIKPRYNSQFKRDRGYYCLLPGDHYRGDVLKIIPEKEDGFYPSRSRRILQSFSYTLSFLYPMERTVNGYNINYSILPERMDPESFRENRECLTEIFKKPESFEVFLEILSEKMMSAAEKERFSEAIYFRDLLKALERYSAIDEMDRKLRGSEFILRIPSEDKMRYLRIKNGLIEKAGTSHADNVFFDEEWTWDKFSDRAINDFKSILISEIRELPREWIDFGI